MIENRELYSFEETEETADPIAPEIDSAVTESGNVDAGPPKFLYQSIIAVICLVFTISLYRHELQWAYWIRERLHYAINSPAESTFGVLWNSKFIQNMVRNGNNLIRLEQVTQTLSEQVIFPEDDSSSFEDSVWPVPGNIINEYTGKGPFGTGVILKTTGNARVIAVAAGDISRIIQVTGGWVIEIDHGSGWSSVYQPITQLQIGINQRVETGQIIGRMNSNKLFLEIKHNSRPVNPRTVIH
ncbi:MAG: M23 family metallopeptidase [Firmicutes bacterium]|nr:M23 family metallopeptidase [Bacillota bacterium]